MTHRQRILLVEDDPAIAKLLEKVFQSSEFAVDSLPTSEDMVRIVSEQDYDVVLLDKNLPGPSGMDVLRILRRERPELQILLMTAFPSVDTCLEALRLGAYDYLLKPFDDLRLVVEKTRKAAERAAVERDRRRLRSQVEREVETGDRDISAALAQAAARAEATVITLVQAAEKRDPTRRGHAERVGRISEAIARTLRLSEYEVDLIGTAARMADVGFVSVPDRVVLKPGPLDPAERALVQEHVQAATDAIATLSRGPRLLPLVRHHHERWDGTGYPDGLAGEAIPLGARIIAAADTFDALVSPRPYHPSRTRTEAMRVLRGAKGSQHDPTVVDALESVRHLPMPDRF